MRGGIISLFACFFFVLAVSPSAALEYNVFILAGQSNMAGRGGIVQDNSSDIRHWDGYIPTESLPNPQILRLNDELLWEEAHEPIHEGISLSNCSNNFAHNAIGPGMPFSSSLLKRVPTFGVIGLVPCAVGDTSISEWSKGNCLYARMMRRVRAALQQGGVLRGMLWYQGEADTETLEDAELYQGRLEAFFNNVRADLSSPDLPIIQVALASGGDINVREIVRKAQLNTSLANVKCVDAAGLQLIEDQLHLNTAAQVQLGSMLSYAYARYFQGN